jgi:transcriptional regulator with XRE-family HTH domain
LTQEAAAARAGIDLKHWQRIERGSVNITMRTMVRVAAALGWGFWDLRG